MTLPMSEAQLLAAITEAAKLYGWLVYHTHDSRHSAAGFPDLVMVRGPRLLFWELKAERGVVTEDQAAWLHELGIGHEARVIRPPELDWALAALA